MVGEDGRGLLGEARRDRLARVRDVPPQRADVELVLGGLALDRVDDNSSLLPPPTPADLQPSVDSYVDGQRP